MGWIDNLSRRMGERSVKKQIDSEDECKIPGISQELDILESLRQELILKDIELSRTRLEWDRTFDSIVDNIVLIDRNKTITKANNSFHDCIEREVGHVEFVGMNWEDFKTIAILSTPKGVMTGQRARQLGVGGEVLCKVW